MPMSKVLVFQYMMIIAVVTPALPASWVIIAISGKRPSRALSVEPGLKPNQPSHRISTPRPNSGMLWPGIARGAPSEAYLPRRGPSCSRIASAADAPQTSTTIEPAKSWTWIVCASQPPPKIQCATTG